MENCWIEYYRNAIKRTRRIDNFTWLCDFGLFNKKFNDGKLRYIPNHNSLISKTKKEAIRKAYKIYRLILNKELYDNRRNGKKTWYFEKWI